MGINHYFKTQPKRPRFNPSIYNINVSTQANPATDAAMPPKLFLDAAPVKVIGAVELDWVASVVVAAAANVV